MRTLIALTALCALLLAGCQTQVEDNDTVACTLDAKQCPDGSYVGRVPPDCEFAPCPGESDEAPSKCDYPESTYISKDPDECARIEFLCIEGTEPFNNECGCGCAPVENEEGKVFCNPEQRGVNFCTTEYDPVCGWFSQDVKCIREPCAQTYGNSCEACKNPDVSYYTEGECPSNI